MSGFEDYRQLADDSGQTVVQLKTAGAVIGRMLPSGIPVPLPEVAVTFPNRPDFSGLPPMHRWLAERDWETIERFGRGL
jgi:hypothetical protein